MGVLNCAGTAWILISTTTAWCGTADPPAAAGPAPEATALFETYVRVVESGLDAIVGEKDGFLWARSDAQRARLRTGEIVCESRKDKARAQMKHGLIHDWVGAVFIPGANIEQVLAVVQDYENHKRIYAPDVRGSQILEHKGNDFRVRLRLFRRKVVTVVLDTDNEIHYERLGGRDWRSRSYTSRVVEIANAGRTSERELLPGKDHGYLWRLSSYWLFRERDGGVYVECEAISLSRSLPVALGAVIQAVIRSLPEDALRNTLRRTREEALHRARGVGEGPGPGR